MDFVTTSPPSMEPQHPFGVSCNGGSKPAGLIPGPHPHTVQTNFLLGTLAITEHARLTLQRLPYDLIARHAINEHGLITPAEAERNAMSLKVIGPIVSRYHVDPTDLKAGFVRIETDATWGETLVSIERIPPGRRPET